MNRKILFSIVSIVTALVMAGGATYAFFTSSATSTGNVFAAGNLTLQINDVNNPTPTPAVVNSFGLSGMIPGQSKTGFVSLDNTGTIDINHVTLAVSQPANSTPSLADVLDITAAKLGSESTCTITPTNLLPGWETALEVAVPPTLTQLIAHGEFNAVPAILTHGTAEYLCVTFTMDQNTGNTYQNATTTDTFSFVGKQDASQTP